MEKCGCENEGHFPPDEYNGTPQTRHDYLSVGAIPELRHSYIGAVCQDCHNNCFGE